MKIRFMVLFLICGFCLTSFSQFETDKASNVSFIGIHSVKLTCDTFTNGDLLMTVNFEYENKNEEDLIVSRPKAKVLVIDKNYTKDNDDLFATPFYDYCENGIQIKPKYKNFEAGEYLPELNDNKDSIRFSKGVNIMKLNFKVGTLFDNDKTKNAKIDDSENFKVASKSVINNAIRIANALNGEEKNESKLVFLFEGIGNITKNGRIITFENTVKMVYPLARRHVDYIFQDKNSIK